MKLYREEKLALDKLRTDALEKLTIILSNPRDNQAAKMNFSKYKHTCFWWNLI